jgi:hypothetical protein
MAPSVGFKTEDRQWDARFNVQTEQDLATLRSAVEALALSGRFKYVLISGVEIGTRPAHDDYNVRHVHMCMIFHNRISKASILKNLAITQGNGYYLVPRNRDLPYSGWREHHIKAFTKVDPDVPILYEYGELPMDVKEKKAVSASSEEKKRKLDDILIEMKALITDGKEDDAFKKFPRNYLTYGEKIKAMVLQKRDFFKDKRHPHVWVYGFAGTGKTALLSFIYPKYYKKNLCNRFFDLFDPKEHTHVMLEDLDHQAVERLGINFIKTICDEAGFPIDQKYKTPQLISTTCLVTSNFNIGEIMSQQENTAGLTQNLPAMMRRFYHVRIDELLRLLQLKLIPKWDRVKLQKEGNTDNSKLFMTYDYVSDTPLCIPIKEPEYYQEVIRDYYYKY